MENTGPNKAPKKLIWFLKEKPGKGLEKGHVFTVGTGLRGEDPGKPVRMKPLRRGSSEKKGTGGAGECGLMREGRKTAKMRASRRGRRPTRHGAGEAGRGHIHSVLDSAHLNCLPAAGLVLFQVLGI